ncbi:MAG: MFS transporter [Sphaerochaetaceae bacterium]|jgi:hypothetical protein|nr:MFS transporter [Sphaerochaetaceae bacterium]
MVRTKYLSEEEKKIGQAHLYRSEAWNGLGVSMLGDTIVYILAVRFGAGNIALGYIASAMYIVGIILPMTSRIFRNRNVVRLQTINWLLRGFISLLYLLLLWVEGTFAVSLLLFVYTMFCTFRLLGMVSYDYTFKSITTSRNRGRVIGNANVAFQAVTIIARFVNFIVTSLQSLSGIVGMVGLQMFGVVANTFASYHVSKIPCRTTIEYKKGRTMVVLFREAMADRNSRTRLLVYWIYITVTVVLGMTVAFLTKEVGLSSSLVFLYATGVSLAVVLSGSFCKFFSDRLGSRPLIIANGFALIISIVGWIVVPVTAQPYLFFILGLLTNFFLGVINILIRRLISAVIPDDEGVGFNSMVNFVIAFFALFGGLAGGALATVGLRITHELHIGTFNLGNSYILTHSLALALAMTGLVLSVLLREKGSYSTKDAAQIMFSLHGIRAFLDMDRLNKATDPIKRKSLLLSLGTNLTGVATGEIRSTLASPFSDDKGEVIRGLFDRPRPSLADDLIKDAFDTDSYTQIESIFALGSLTHNEKVEKALVYLLEHGTNLSRSTAAKSLARVTRDSRYLTRVESISDLAVNTTEEMNFLVARNIMDKEGSFFEELFLAAKKGMSATFRQTRYSVLAHFLEFTPPLAELYEQKNLGREDYLADFIEEARDVVEIDQQRIAIISAFEHREWSRIWAICFSMTRNLTFRNTRMLHLYRAVQEAQTMPRAQTDGDDALAALYFCYHLKKNCD